MLKVRRNGRKGFTLAELLIVVAIIAVLVAIAVPLFVGSLNKAREARDNANIRAVRGAAVVYLLEKSTDPDLWPADGVTGWTVKATLNANGEISQMTVEHQEKATDECPEAGKVTENDDGTFTVGVYVKNTELKSIAAVS